MASWRENVIRVNVQVTKLRYTRDEEWQIYSYGRERFFCSGNDTYGRVKKLSDGMITFQKVSKINNRPSYLTSFNSLIWETSKFITADNILIKAVKIYTGRVNKCCNYTIDPIFLITISVILYWVGICIWVDIIFF